jgi:PAS domain S-box-containing protein
LNVTTSPNGSFQPAFFMTRFFGQMKLRSYLIALVVAALLPLVIFASVMIVVFGREQRLKLDDNLLDASRALSLALDRELEASIRSLQVLATSEELELENLKQFYDEAAKVVKTQRYWDSIALYDESGRQLMSLRAPFGSASPGLPNDPERLRVIATGRPEISNLYIGRTAQEPLIAVTVPVFRDGKVKYALAASIYPRSLLELVAQQITEKDWTATIIDRKAMVIVCTENFEQFLGKPATPSFAAKSREEAEGTWRDVDRDASGVYAAFHRSNHSGWSVKLEIPVSVADAAYWRSLISTTVGSAVLLLLGLSLAYFIARRISNSIAALSGAAETLGRGEIPQAPASAIVEVGRVAQALEKAAAERKRAEDARSRLAAIVASSHNAIVGRTLDGTITSWNKGAEKIFGYRPEEAIGRSLTMLFPADQMDIVESNSEAIRQGRIIESYEGVRLRKDGGRIHVSATISPVKDDSGYTIGVASIARDITEQKRAEDDLRRQKEILQQIFDHVPVMLNFVDEHGRIQMVNREWERTLGWALKEIQKGQLDIFAELYPHPEYRQTVLRFLAESNGEWRDFKPRVKDGRIIDTTWAVVHLSDGTSIGIGKDITDRKRAEKELRISREHLRSLAAYLQSVREEERSRIARELHDEIGQSLTGIKFTLVTSLRHLHGGDAADLAQALALTNELIGKVRDLSLELRPAMLDDLGLLPALRWHLDRYTTQFDIKVNFKHTGLEGRRLEPETEIAAYRIVQEALTNVARHAKIDKVDVSVSADLSAVHVRIQDKGAGFDPHSMSFSATGGLSGMRERTTLLGGWLKIDSAPGSGALVSAELPLGTKASAVRRPAGEGRQAV